MNFLNKLSISRRLALLIGFALLGVVAIAVAALVSERRLLLEERQIAVRQTVEIAHDVVAHHHAQIAAAGLSEAEAQQRAKAALRALRYSGNEYFFVSDMHPRMVMHPIKPELDGKDLSQNEDPSGKRLFVDFAKTVQGQGAGFVDYLWPKPGSEQPVPKLSFVKGFAPWGWVIGSGVYIDTVDSVIAERAATFAVAAALLMGVMLALGLVITRSLLGQLGGEPVYATRVARRIAEGDLSLRVDVRPGDTDSLLHAIASMRDGLSGLVSRVRESSESVATASSQIAQGNLDLSQRTEQQATALQQTAASMDELGSTVRHTADNARQASQLAQGASAVAVRGGEVVGRVVETMNGINESSRRIADIIGVVDGIAFQTNILALNAAVEAARAGEQGRGFAVVASEVRSLASRSAAAAKEVKQLIGASVDRVEQGSTLVDEARQTMNEVVGSIRRAADLMGEISAASAEQSQGVAQVGQAVTQMDQTTQQNAALVEQSAAAAESLQGQATRLVQSVSVFKLAPAAA